jgi:hypothetical protein
MEVLYIAYHFEGQLGKVIIVEYTSPTIAQYTEQYVDGPYIVSCAMPNL